MQLDRLREPRLQAMVGYTPEEWAGGNELLLTLLDREAREREITAHLGSCETGEPVLEEHR